MNYKLLILFKISMVLSLTQMSTLFADAKSLIIKKTLPIQVQNTGDRVYLFDDGIEKFVGSKYKKKIRDLIESKLKLKGFKFVKKRVDSHLSIYLTAKKQNHGISVTQTIKHIVDGKVIRNNKKHSDGTEETFTITLFINDYGKRPLTSSWLSIDSPKGKLDKYKKKLLFSIESEFDSLFLKAPKTNKVMNGEPGCTPRFGFERNNKRITRVIPESPAEKAGFKVGDIILSIDSEPVANEISSHVYESRIKVPVKLSREKKIIRTEIQSAIICD